MAATGAALVAPTYAGPLCFLPSKLTSAKEVLCGSPLHHRGFAALVKKAVGNECRKSSFQPAPVASADVETRAAEGEAASSSSSGSANANVMKRFKTREVWRKDPAKVTYLDSQYTRFAFINEVRFSTDLNAVFAKYGNLDLREIVHILYRLQERREGRAALKLIEFLESSPVYSQQLDEATYRACLAAISNYPQMLAKATKLFEAAKKKGVVRMTETYNMYLALVSKRGAVDVMEDVLKQIDAAGLKRTVETWNYVIQGYGKKRDLDRAVAAFTELQAARLKPTAETYRVLIEAFSSAGRTEDGERMVRESGIQLTEVQYNAIMDGYANEKRPEKVGETLKEAQAAGVEPNNDTFLILLKTFAGVGDAKGAWETYRALRSAGHPPSGYAFQLLASARRKDKRLAGVRVRHVVELLETIGESRIRVKEVMERRTWSVKWVLPEVKGILRALAKDKKDDLAEELVEWCFSRPAEERMLPDEEALAVLIQAKGAAGHVDAAWQVYNMIGKGRAKHITPTKRAFGSLVQAYVAAGDVARAEIILEESEKRSGNWPQADTYSYFALMRHYAEKGDAQKVQALFDRALAAEVAPNASTFMMLLMAYDVAGQRDKALEVYDAQGTSHLGTLTEGDVRKLTDFLQKHGRPDEAKNVQDTFKKKPETSVPAKAATPARAIIPPALETAEPDEKPKVMADLLTTNLRGAERRKLSDALISGGYLQSQEDYLRLAEAIMDKKLKQSGARVLELLPYMRKQGFDIPHDTWTHLVRRADRAMQAASMFYAAKREAGPDWDDTEAAQALAEARRVAGKPRWVNHVVWCLTSLGLSIEETLNPRLWPDEFRVSDVPGSVSTLQQSGRPEQAADLEARIREIAPETVFERSGDHTKGAPKENEVDPKESEVKTVEGVANIPSDV
ncbi:putative Pentatricopeptide repeat domain containing protein [Klebsormidium nitens]|uniref:Putative Pentatricopeptide repeat domain containing protein n=1 Tax=Klebsormidium nitens TaxID=105231 RepID=A0A1Y1HQW5_KLENI|nr:putative Pentatricopeptide repeat domain containing protein [Klebsormidium nitens]|eukprot:GAQ78218.1 putative Pentatricopeptide repeat domain containing protein [Klebsormidium nitens]